MNIFVIVLLAIFSACSLKTKPKDLLGRYPGSLQGSSYVVGTEFFQTEPDRGEFYQLLKMAQQKGVEKIQILPQKTELLSKASMSEDLGIAGDFFVLIGTNFTTNDEIIRKGDYDDIYAVTKRLSWLKFRVTINLVASVRDLKVALSNTRPTIIVWTSHGNATSFYDFNLIPVQADIFKNASKSVYQFHLASCEGFQAIQSKYLPYIPETMKHWSWDVNTKHPGTLKPHFAEDVWSPYTNYPGIFTYKDLLCEKFDSGYVIKDQRKKARVGTYVFKKDETCNYAVANSTDLHVCSYTEEGWDVFSRRTLEPLPGEAYKTNADCISLLPNVRKNKLCRKIDDGYFHPIDVRTDQVLEEAFPDAWECYDYVDETDSL